MSVPRMQLVPNLSPTTMPDDSALPPEEWRGQNQGFSREGYEYCPILPWYNEVVTRMHEAAAAGSHIVNLGFTHPRGYIPNQILRRKEIRAVLKGWDVNTAKSPETPVPNSWFLPRGSKDLEHCELSMFMKEIEKREKEAVAEARALSLQYGRSIIGIVDLTPWHPRGGIPDDVLFRLQQRKNKSWQEETRKEIDRLNGLANKDESFAKTQEERVERVDDPTKVKAAAQELRERAAKYREQAAWLKRELGDGSTP